jgi:hypothetical protein
MSKLDDIDIGGKVISQEFLGKTSHLPSIWRHRKREIGFSGIDTQIAMWSHKPSFF